MYVCRTKAVRIWSRRAYADLSRIGLSALHMTRDKVLVLDGGFSNELNKRISFDIHKDPLWTAKAVVVEPEAVMATHLAYLEAGADIIETSTYQATLQGFREVLSLDSDSAESFFRKAVALAKQAVIQFTSTESGRNRDRPLIAGSVGSYGAYLADGSEYTGSFMDNVSKDVIIETHLPRIKILLEEGVDLLAFETIPSLKEAQILMELVDTHFPSTKVWVTFSVRLNDENRKKLETACGDSLISAYTTLIRYPQLWGFGLNCCNPDDIAPLLEGVRKCKGSEQNGRLVKLVVYPNTGQKWTSKTGWVSDPNIRSVSTYVDEWISAGADVIGGCCQVGSNEIKNIRTLVDKFNSNLTINDT